jgi:hypothetical protein
MAVAPTPAASSDTAQAAPADDDSNMPMDDNPVLFTVMGKPEGPYTLVEGDEDDDEGDEEGGDAGAASGGAMDADSGQTFDTPQALMQGIMKMLNPSKGAEDSFGKGFRGEADDTAMPAKGPMA